VTSRKEAGVPGTESAERAVYNVAEAAAKLGVSRATAYELARRQELPGGRRLGGRVIVVKAELDSYLGEQPSPKAEP
jgi:excisionase family DNA binding protein